MRKCLKKRKKSDKKTQKSDKKTQKSAKKTQKKRKKCVFFDVFLIKKLQDSSCNFCFRFLLGHPLQHCRLKL